MSLVIPSKMEQLWHHPISLIAFAITFALICSIWYAHNRLFAHYFVPTPVNIVLNFFTLGSVSMLVYSVQLYVHFLHDRSAIGFYAGCLAAAFALLAALYTIGLRQRREFLSEGDVRWGIRRATRFGCIAGGLALYVFMSRYWGDPEYQLALGAYIAGSAIVARAILAVRRI
ncbi:MAG: TMEM175 family protein [Candidatus Eremiobacteraeota bacterium]|nr:TMEM175 family protein [Candidatus Eremiobacteraeota bacterium]